jgi:hypothetical protein
MCQVDVRVVLPRKASVKPDVRGMEREKLGHFYRKLFHNGKEVHLFCLLQASDGGKRLSGLNGCREGRRQINHLFIISST